MMKFLRLPLAFILLQGSQVFCQTPGYVSADDSRNLGQTFQPQKSDAGAATINRSPNNRECNSVIKIEDEEQITIFPDPFTSLISVEVNGGWVLGLYDSNNKCIATKWQYENGICTLETSGLLPGFYFVTVKKQSGRTITRKLTKQ